VKKYVVAKTIKERGDMRVELSKWSGRTQVVLEWPSNGLDVVEVRLEVIVDAEDDDDDGALSLFKGVYRPKVRIIDDMCHSFMTQVQYSMERKWERCGCEGSFGRDEEGDIRHCDDRCPHGRWNNRREYLVDGGEWEMESRAMRKHRRVECGELDLRE